MDGVPQPPVHSHTHLPFTVVPVSLRASTVTRTRSYPTMSAKYGYRTSTDHEGRSILVTDEAEQATLSKIREWHAAGLSIRQIAQRLDDAGLQCRGARWHRTTIHRLTKRET